MNQVICCGGSAIDRGDLVDHPVAIVQHLIGLVHSLSLNVIDSIESWMSVLENEVADIAVSKHFTHLRELRRMQSQVEGYIMPLRDIIIELQEDAVELLMEAENEELQHALDSSSQSLPRQLSSHNLEASFRTTKKISSLYRKSIASVKNQSTLCKTVLLDGVEKQPITFPILEPFLGDRPINFLESILIGDDDLEIKGAVYWGEQIASLEKSLDVIATDCHHSSDEKRNFYSYSLTVVTVFLAPLTILTSYW
jgi:Mg2+ and Co2+ transporter CorA